MWFHLILRERKSAEKFKDRKNIFSFQIEFRKTKILNNSVASQYFLKRWADAFLGEISVAADVNNFDRAISFHAIGDSL